MKGIVLFFLVLIGLSEAVYGQKLKENYKYLTVGWNANAMNYVGELDPGPGFFSPGVKFTRENLGIFITKRINPRMTLRGNLSYGVIEGRDHENASYSSKDIYRKIRNLSFRSSIWEIKSDVMIDLFPHRGKPVSRVEYTPYIFLGIAYFHHNPKAMAPASAGGHWVELQPLRLEGKDYSLNQIALPVGMGFRYKMGKRWDLAFEIGWRFTFTDYLDDVSSSYTGGENFKDNPLALSMHDRSMEGLKRDPMLNDWVRKNVGYHSSYDYISIKGYGNKGDQRGDPKRKDWYMVTGFHFSYLLFPKVIRCIPKYRNDFL